MAIDQLYLDAIAATVADLYRGVESAVNRAVAARLKDGLGPTWQQDKADALAKLRKSAQTILNTLNSKAPAAIRQAIADAYADGYGNALADLPKAWFPKSGIGQAAARAKGVVPNTAVIETIARAVHQDLGPVSSNILRSTLDAYRAVQAESAARIASGAFTRREAAQAAWQRLVDRGVTSFTDKAGRRWQLSSYAEMVTRTNAQRAAIEAQNHRLSGAGIQLVYVSDVTQECRLCRPFEGKVLSIGGPVGRVKVQHATRDGETVEVDVVATLAAAQRAGLHHPNCRHSVSAYLPGVTRLPEGATADPDGDDARQRQRAIERQIRKYKARAEAALTPEAKKAAEARVRQWQAALRGHLKAHPQLKRLRYREQIGAGNVPPRRGPAGGPVGEQSPAWQLDIDGDAKSLLTTPPKRRDEPTGRQVPLGQLTLDDIRREPAPAPVRGVEGGDFTSLRKIGGQGGSNPGGLFEDEHGNRWYVKTQKSPEHAANEIAAARLYRAAGIDAPDVRHGRGAPGLPDGPQTASRIVDAVPATPDELRKPAREGFAVDAWLANWDVAGLTFDNMLRLPDGRVVRIDTGGALLFRAQGSPKGSAFGNKVTEWDTLRDPDKAPQAAKLFKDITLDEQIDSLRRLERVTPDEVRRIVAESGLPAEVADKLIARRADLLAKLPKLLAERDKPKPGEATLARLLDHHDGLSHSKLLDQLVTQKGTAEERAEWAAAVKQFDELADKGEQSKSHQTFAGKLAKAKDPVATTNRRLGQLKDPALRAAALRALQRELAARAARPKPPGMRQGLRHNTNDEGVEWVNRAHPTPDLPDDESEAVTYYSTTSGYDEMNGGLRNPPPTARAQKAIDDLDKAMKRSRLPESVIVHRGVGDGFRHVLGVDIDDEAALKALVGQTRQERAYLSTSVGARAAFDGMFRLMIRVPQGHEAINMIKLSDFPNERELLLRRDTKYVFHAVYRRNGQWYMEMEVVPDDWEPGPDWVPDPYGDADVGWASEWE